MVSPHSSAIAPNQQVWKIAKWETVYETADSRRHKTLAWVSMPTSFTSTGYQSMLDEFEDEAPAIYGAWCAFVAYAAQCPTRGTLSTSAGDPVSFHRIMRATGFPVAVFEKMAAWARKAKWLIPAENIETDGQPVVNQSTTSQQPVVNQSSNDLRDEPNEPNERSSLVADVPEQNKTKQTRASTSTTTSSFGKSARRTGVDVDAQKIVLEGEELADVLRECLKVSKIVTPADVKRDRPQHMADRSLLFKAIVLGRRHFSEDWLRDAVEAVRMHPHTKNKAAYFMGVLQSKTEALGENLGALFRRVDDEQSKTNPLTAIEETA